jgi:hypothetical protein
MFDGSAPPGKMLAVAATPCHCFCRWQRVRWRPTSHAEGVHVERRLLDLLAQTGYEQIDVKVCPAVWAVQT